MQFKLQKFCSKRFAKAIRPFFAVCLGLALTFPIRQGLAVLTVTPSNGGSQSPSGNGNNSFYYFVQNTTGPSPTPSPSLPAFINFRARDISVNTATQEADATALQNYFEVAVTSNLAITGLTGTQRAAVVFYAMPDSGTAHPAPIAAVNGQACNGSNPSCVAFRQINTGKDHYYAALYPTPASTVTVGFYPNDICSDAGFLGIPIQPGCTGGGGTSTLASPTSGNPTTMQLKFSIVTIPDATPTASPSPSASPLDTVSGPVSMIFQIDTPTFPCPTSTGNVYFPGDGGILFYQNDVSTYPASPIFTFNRPNGGAPARHLIVVGNDGALPVVDSSYATSNTIVKALEAGKTESAIDGFTNTTDGNDHAYQLSFMFQDQAGIVVPPPDVNTCKITAFASEVSGFLPAGTNRCFIATATFGSDTALPVVMLQHFRDKILLKTELGDTFVSWYYSWSPHAADWLMEHPAFRIPVLYALAPLQIFAWFCLHSEWMIGLFGLALLELVFVGGLLHSARRRGSL